MAKNLKQQDFLLNSTTKDGTDQTTGFVFPSVSESDSEEEMFEDSLEVVATDDIGKLMTPKAFKSSFAKHYEASLLTPADNSCRLKRPSSLALSPIETVDKKAKPSKMAPKSALPRLC